MKKLSYKIGDKFRYSNGNRYLLVRINTGKTKSVKACLVNISDGTMFGELITIRNEDKVTEGEFNKITGLANPLKEFKAV